MLVTPHLKTVLKDYQHSAVKSLHGPAHHLHPPFAPPPPPSPIHAGGGGYDEDSSARSPPTATTIAAAGGGAISDAGGSPTAAVAGGGGSAGGAGNGSPYAPPLPAVQQLPILTTSDTSSSDLCFTPLEDVSISCFSVGGEKRLCLPQVLQSVLGDFTLAQINNQCDNLLIYCSRCTREQLNVLKGQAILPSSAFSCGLITKSDAERLCSALLHAPSAAARGLKPPALRIKKETSTIATATSNYTEQQNGDKIASSGVKTEGVDAGGNHRVTANGARTTSPPRGCGGSAGGGGGGASRLGRIFRVRHECFGCAVGTLHEALYVAKQAKCIECVECKAWHSPQQFVKHVHWQHARGESQTVHWGFDSARWRHYLLPLADGAPTPAAAGGADEDGGAPAAVGADACCASRSPAADDTDADRVLDLMRDRYEGVVPFVVYDAVAKADVKKEAHVNGATKRWNMPLKRKLLHQAAKCATSPPPVTPPPPPPPMKRDTASPAALASKKPKLALSGEEYMLMAQTYLQPPMEPYLQTAAVFQQFPLPFPYATLPPHALPLAAVTGGAHPSAKEAKLRQEIAERNADLTGVTGGGGGEVVLRDAPLPPTPKKQRLIRHMQEQQQRRKLELMEVQKSPDSTTVPTVATPTPTTPVHERRYSEIDLSTTDTEDTASEGAAPVTTAPPPPLPGDGSLDEVERLLRAHPQKDRIVGIFRRLLDECEAKGGRIRELETRVETLQERLSLASIEEAATPSATSAESEPSEQHTTSVITSPARPTGEGEANAMLGGGGGDTATSTSHSDDAKPHCPSASAPTAAT